MSAKFVRRIVEVFIAIFIIGFALRLLRSIAAAFSGEFGTLTWPVQASAIGERISLGNAEVAFGDGLLTLVGHPIAQTFDLVVTSASVVLFVIALLSLRGVLLRFSEGEFVVDANTAALKRIGAILLAVCALSVVHALILQPIILSGAAMPNGFVLHPSISWDVEGMTNIWLHYDVPLFTFMLGGLALLLAEAFRAGSAYREDSESMV